jgi:hypothetical protein
MFQPLESAETEAWIWVGSTPFPVLPYIATREAAFGLGKNAVFY